MNQSEILTIGYLDCADNAKLAIEIQRLLADQGIGSKVLGFSGDSAGKLDALLSALEHNYIDVVVGLLTDFPTKFQGGTVITALTARTMANDWLLLRKDTIAPDGIFGLPDHAVIATQHQHTAAQMLQLNQSFKLTEASSLSEGLENLRTGKLDAIIFSGAEVQWSGLEITDLNIIKLSTREIVPMPGQGAIAMATVSTDVSTRKLLQSLHHRNTAKTCNVERKTMELLAVDGHTSVGVYCEMDYADNYHVWAVAVEYPNNTVKKYSYSSSTSYGLAEQICKLLTTSEVRA